MSKAKEAACATLENTPRDMTVPAMRPAYVLLVNICAEMSDFYEAEMALAAAREVRREFTWEQRV